MQYLMHLPAAGAPSAPQPAPAAQPVAEQPVQYLMHLQPAGPMAMQSPSVCQPPVQQVHMPMPTQMPAQMPEPQQVQQDASPSVAIANAPQAPRAEKEEKRENAPKSAQTEVSSGP